MLSITCSVDRTASRRPALVESVLNHPQQIVLEKEARKTYPSQIDFDGGKMFWLPVIVPENINPAAIGKSDPVLGTET
ncbi:MULTISPECIES: hypothetical protein [Planktothricoides]|uniref:Uncharacterized protein n=1 Tax=Planktothricoides raciborskii FACHB-1370 TaxID=2949576 RepID=A0ABR8ENN6_9CYAN|nr:MULTISPECIES: hypothetical protein [Planktothricoides]KOR38581.1 hypothetical protein AM228_01025 [Planktothricoides sp. SR001]MBD2547573.1 hypothetical protein [Planktothricoides raciborskii FACHB-1370]MBD2586049.1 hypothetical protein [Planktothricoides raciborskii FACHB-1261]